MLELRTAAP